MSKRADRRARSFRIAQRRRTVHLKQVHADGAVDCVCELANFYFEKRPLGCGCSKRRRGQPRGCGGKQPQRYDVFEGRWHQDRFAWIGCKDHVRLRIYKERQLAREYGQGIVSGRLGVWDELARAVPSYC